MNVDVVCPEECGQLVQKHQLATVPSKNSPACTVNYGIVSEKHWPVQKYPVPCPNRCQIGAVEHNALKDHFNLCHLQVVECNFQLVMQAAVRSFRGKTQRSTLKRTQKKHLAQMASASKEEFLLPYSMPTLI